MPSLSVSQRKELKAIAHHYKPVVQIGQKGLTPGIVAAVDKALSDHELIKIKFLDFKDEKSELIDSIMLETKAEVVGLIGNIAILYRENPDKPVVSGEIF